MTDESRSKVASRGLEGVVATTTAICKVEDNSLVYRGYSIDELATKAEYEEVAYLLLNGDLPTKDQLRDFKAELVKHRTLSPFLRNILQEMSESGTAMDVLRTVASASAVEDPAEGDNSQEAEYRKAIRLTAKLPTILASYMRRRRGEQPIPPDPSLGHAANFAHMAGVDGTSARGGRPEHVLHPAGRARPQRLDIHRARRRRHERGHARRGDRGVRRAQRPASRWRDGRDDEDARRDRIARSRRDVRRQGAPAEIQVPGLRSPRVRHRGSAREAPSALRDGAREGVEGQAVLRDPGPPRESDRGTTSEDVTERGREGERRERRLLRRDDVHVPRHPGRPRHVHLRPRTHRRLERAHHGAARRQSTDPARSPSTPARQESATSPSRSANRLFDAAVSARRRPSQVSGPWITCRTT